MNCLSSGEIPTLSSYQLYPSDNIIQEQKDFTTEQWNTQSQSHNIPGHVSQHNSPVTSSQAGNIDLLSVLAFAGEMIEGSSSGNKKNLEGAASPGSFLPDA